MKYFAMVNREEDLDFYILFVYEEDTPIPTAKEIVEKRGMSLCCMEDEIVELTKEEFLQKNTELLESILCDAEVWEEMGTWHFWR